MNTYNYSKKIIAGYVREFITLSGKQYRMSTSETDKDFLMFEVIDKNGVYRILYHHNINRKICAKIRGEMARARNLARYQ